MRVDYKLIYKIFFQSDELVKLVFWSDGQLPEQDQDGFVIAPLLAQ